jgi:glycosyltransferase involved in cell wall biosynthesis
MPDHTPRLLWITMEPPDRNLGGGNIRQAYLLEAAAQRTEAHLLLVGGLRDQATRSVLASVTEVEAPLTTAPSSRLRRRVDDLRRVLVDRQPSEVVDSRGRMALIRPLIDRLLDEPPGFDVVCVEHHGLAPLLPPRRQQPWVMSMQYLPSEVAAHKRSVAPSRRTTWLLGREHANAARRERWIADHYDLVLTCSPDDARRFPGPSTMVPNGVDADRLRPTPLPAAPRLVLTATLDYFPNVDGAVWFCDEVLPKVRADVPGVTLDLVGRSPVAEVEALGSREGVSVHADVPEIRPYLERARVAVVPIRVGSGTRLKALDAMAAGRPVVGTTIGLAGLDLVDGGDAVFADDASSMATAIVGLLREDDRAERIASAGRRTVDDRVRWDRIGEAFVAALLDVAIR